jgi:hypothetical protein
MSDLFEGLPDPQLFLLAQVLDKVTIIASSVRSASFPRSDLVLRTGVIKYCKDNCRNRPSDCRFYTAPT